MNGGTTQNPRDLGGENQTAKALRFHRTHAGLREKEAGFQIGIGHPIPIIALPVIDHIAMLDTGIADENIETAKLLHDAINRLLAGFLIRDIKGGERGFETLGLERIGLQAEGFGIAAVEHDMRACGGQ